MSDMADACVQEMDQGGSVYIAKDDDASPRWGGGHSTQEDDIGTDNVNDEDCESISRCVMELCGVPSNLPTDDVHLTVNIPKWIRDNLVQEAQRRGIHLGSFIKTIIYEAYVEAINEGYKVDFSYHPISDGAPCVPGTNEFYEKRNTKVKTSISLTPDLVYKLDRLSSTYGLWRTSMIVIICGGWIRQRCDWLKVV